MRVDRGTKFGIAMALVVLGGCASDHSSAAPDETGITHEELAAGASYSGEEMEPEGDDVAVDDSSASSDGTAGDAGTGTTEGTGVAALAGGCINATGYRRGVATTICTTTADGKPIEVSTAAAYEKMQAAAQAAGVSLRVVSGFRTMAQQRTLYAAYKAGRGNLAAPPGFSNHQSGLALDLNTRGQGVYSWLVKHGATYGFRRTVPSEKWHWEH